MPAFPEGGGRRRTAGVAAGAGAGLALLASVGGAYLDGAPPGHTGGFGEPDCRACHVAGPADHALGSVALTAPDAFVPGAEYAVEVRLRHPDLARGGFQLSVRFAAGPEAGRQAGRLAAADERAETVESGGVQYARHGAAGTDPGPGGEIAWSLRWSAPAEAPAAVLFHLAANAANYDDSELGDRIYLASARAEPAEGPRPAG